MGVREPFRPLLDWARLSFAYYPSYAYSTLQQLAWPDVVRPQTERAAVAYASLTGRALTDPQVTRWRAAYTRHVYREQPALMAALRLTAYPDRLDQHVTYRGAEHLDALAQAPVIVALSRTSMSYAVLWALARRRLPAAIVIEPGMSPDAALATITRWGYAADAFTLIPADRRSPVRIRDALSSGRWVVLYPESRPPAGGRSDIVPFLAREVRVPLGAASMAARFGVPLLPARAIIARRRVVVETAPPLRPADFPDAPQLNRALFAALARWVANTPAQWLGWEHLARAE